ncbi:hypothetical protein [Pseudoalteromonas sp. T1lg88]|uniref:hypothetical protein n=1 Tax=Pseudoalteromonas sp. T1lg88 TaxID=2077104 RepID=UPI0018FED94B|nr:hypothetical protein [Pseudoalteromonas sp. T1lg88]
MMARFCGGKEPSQLLVNAEEFKQRCFIDEKSLFTSEEVWTIEHCNELIRFFVENPDAGDGDFFEKLKVQLEGASLKAKLLIAEMLWLMFLCPSNTGPATKRANIERVVSWGGFTIAPKALEQYLSDKALTGVGSSGTAFNTMRWRELAYLIRLTHELLQLNKAKRTELLQRPGEFSSWLERVPENESRQLRHMLLFLFFPDSHERIFGNTDRQRILVTLTAITKSQYNKMTCRDRDSKLLELRQALEEELEPKS